MKFIVLSRREAEKFTSNTPYVVLSAVDPGSPVPRLQRDENRVGRLLREFHDVGNLGEADDGRSTPVSRDDADTICAFYVRARERDIATMIVHCEAGISRSRGIALALATIDGDPSDHLEAGKPNHSVVHAVLDGWERRTGEHFITERIFEIYPQTQRDGRGGGR